MSLPLLRAWKHNFVHISVFEGFKVFSCLLNCQVKKVQFSRGLSWAQKYCHIYRIVMQSMVEFLRSSMPSWINVKDKNIGLFISIHSCYYRLDMFFLQFFSTAYHFYFTLIDQTCNHEIKVQLKTLWPDTELANICCNIMYPKWWF